MKHSRHDLRIAASNHYVRAVYGEAKRFDTEDELREYITGRNSEMDKRRTEDEETLEGIQHFSNYMHEIGDGTELGQATNTIVRNACKVVGHIADGILHAIESLELNEDKKD